jgi:hypothetical protein
VSAQVKWAIYQVAGALLALAGGALFLVHIISALPR